MQVLPTKELAPYIKHYLFLESGEAHVNKLRLFSDGNTGMVFCLGNPLIVQPQHDNNVHALPNAFAYGQISAFKDLYVGNHAALLIVVFQPHGINRLLGIPANHLKDQIINTEVLFGKQAATLHETLLSTLQLQERIELLNTFFLSLTLPHKLSNQILIEASLDFINRNKGAVTVQQLIKHTGYTERHIERAFSENIGISPKKFGNIVKLHHFLKLLKRDSARHNIAAVSYDAGYADQSHLIKEFKKYTGITPTQYLHNTSRLAINFMKFNVNDSSMSGLYNLFI